jgi:hypothetical protein
LITFNFEVNELMMPACIRLCRKSAGQSNHHNPRQEEVIKKLCLNPPTFGIFQKEFLGCEYLG